MWRSGSSRWSSTDWDREATGAHRDSREEKAAAAEWELLASPAGGWWTSGQLQLGAPAAALQIVTAQRARAMTDEPVINARQVEHVPAVGQAAHGLSSLKVLQGRADASMLGGIVEE